MRAPIRACHSHQTITKLFGCLSKEVVEKLGCISRDRVQATGEGRLPTEAEIGELLQKGKLSPNEEQIKGFMAKMGVDLSGKQDDGEGWKGAYASAAAAVANTHAEPTGMVTVFVPSGEAQQTGSA